MALDAMVAAKRRQVAERCARLPLAQLRSSLTADTRGFARALDGTTPAFILEVKPASPSAGRLRAPDALGPVIAACARYASAVSVLTDATYFGGSPDLLAAVRAALPQPVLCKDIVLGPYQVVEARSWGADAVLLMLSVLDDATYRACLAAAQDLGMDVLTEVTDAAEMARARRLGARLIGINNRDLRTLAVSRRRTEELAPGAPDGALVIAESGIRGPADVLRLRGLVDGFLVGTALARAADPDLAARELIYGRTKVCGLTVEPDAIAAAAAGATHGGLVFAPESPRRVDVRRAEAVRRAAPLEWVGVFVNDPPDRVAEVAARLELAAVQLHGNESPEVIAGLRELLPPGCAVWKAVSVDAAIPDWRVTGADLVLLDTAHPGRRGGTGRPFDWTLLRGLADRSRYGLAGGLRAENVRTAGRLGMALLDVSSGVELAPGRKDPARLARFFAARRGSRREGIVR